MAVKSWNILGLSALALLVCSFGGSQVNALSLDLSNNIHARHNAGHALIAKKRGNERRCKPRPSSSSVPAAADTPAANSPTPNNPAPSPSPTPQQNTPTTPSSGAKAGLAWAAGDRPDILANFKTSHVSTIYNWSPYKVNGADQAGYESVPMLWSTKDIETWKQLVKPGYARFALGFNEPDHGEQASMDPTYAATLWNELMRPLRDQGYTLISPALTSAPNSKDWMRTFLNACGGNCVDKIAVHWYGTNADEFITYLQGWHDAFGLPLWVTEFACQSFVGGAQCSQDQTFQFAGTVKNFMEGASYVERYFPFGMQFDMGNVSPVNQLLGGDGRPTALGSTYFN